MSVDSSVDGRGASPAAIQYHYDVGTEFYQLWLDSGLTYSCALWADGDDLEAAQSRKLDYHAQCAHARGAARVLDIGCGWGSMLNRLTDHNAVAHVVGLTLSQSQADWITARADIRQEVRLEAWSDHIPTDQYDAIISIGAFEHFARHDLSTKDKQQVYQRFFRTCHAWVKPGGCLSLQTIAYGNISRHDLSTYVEFAIFPESDLPTLAEIATASQGYFEIASIRNDRVDYERTSRTWLSRLRSHRTEVIGLVGEEVFRRYDKALALFSIGFHTGRMNLLRIAFQRNDQPRLWAAPLAT